LRTTKLLVGALLLCAALTASAQSKIDASVSYELQRSNGPAGECGCFYLQGGRADGSYRVFDRFSVAGEISGAHASNITGSGVDLSLLTYMAGPRYSLYLKHRLKPFAQFLVGGVHGFASTFPHPGGALSSADSFAFTTGGGLDYGLSRHIGVRVVQIDYLKTYLPNNATDEQNNLRVGAGIVFRIKLRK
jgi:peptidoglycan-associated lipoprotein